MGTNCAQCISVPSAYNCSHCGATSSCLLQESCVGGGLNSPSQVGQCGTPVIEDVSAVRGWDCVGVWGEWVSARFSQCKEVVYTHSLPPSHPHSSIQSLAHSLGGQRSQSLDRTSELSGVISSMSGLMGSTALSSTTNQESGTQC